MPFIQFVWDLDDDEYGNVQHIALHDVTKEEVEEVLNNQTSRARINRNAAGNALIFGYTREGRYLAVIWEQVDENPLTIYPVTAYDVPEPRSKRV